MSFTENMTHAQTVCTRPFLLLLKGPGDEAREEGERKREREREISGRDKK